MKAALGIDFGTTYSAAALVRPPERVAEVVAMESPQGLATCMLATGAHLSPWLFGKRALDQCANPDDLIQDMKRELGEPTLRVGGSDFPPQALVTVFLRHVLEKVAEVCSDVDRVVITAPAAFDPVRNGLICEAMKQALEKEGWNAKVELLAEPIAAAVTYGSQGGEAEKLLVFDWGGGTLDVSFLERSHTGGLKEVATTGNSRLGGRDIDRDVKRELWAQVERTHPGLLTGLHAAARKDFDMNLGRLATRLKEQLSTAQEVVDEIEIKTALKESVEVRLDRTRLNEIIEPHLARCMDAVANGLKLTGWAAADIGQVLLVGGSSLIPSVRPALQSQLGIAAAPFADIDPATAVAQGAALHAAGSEHSVERISGRYIGILARKGFQMSFRPFIAPDAPLPTKQVIYFPLEANQSSLEIPLAVAQQDDVPASKVQIIDHLTMAIRGGSASTRVGIEFALDASNQLEVRVLEGGVELTRAVVHVC